MAYPHDGFWQPMDTARDHRYLNDLWSSGDAPWNTWDAPAAFDEELMELPLKSR
jgi:NDP-sugar pyrophosphorylase family protein